ncbi:GNAT family N-acetyltransferase [Dyadobacter fanqingshengii]|uniref:GNAT family N-acetyltransferase n=1 Tax=Dyadobacter fanqingshengii TaxID=2906443 RepID=A0A9X1TB79_9BACT|nr:GNAT family N-acetyltransferase [Dyadobacter fanqingshengii]MCF0042606.1 GNAT family N-acetyltransferase [Dyadobacter fanqingshengii]USJ36168.1 GNAT family N-acetyltransferase [Dyadobacter fanqingshengii]
MTPILTDRAQICDTTWNDHIHKSLQCVIYAQTFYLDIVCEHWEALVWPTIQHPEIVMPLPIRRKTGFRIIYQPLFCQYLGLFSLKPLTAFELESFIRFLSKEFSYISAYHFNPENSIGMSAFASARPDFHFSKKHTHWLHMRGTYEQLNAGYSSDRKRNLKRSKAVNWLIRRSADINPLITLFAENQTERIPGGVDPNAFVRIKALFNVLRARKQAEVYYAISDGQIQAGILVAEFAGRAIYLFNAADQTGRTGNARTLMLDQYFRDCNGKSMIFDFESPEVGSIASFYRSFGSRPVSFYAISRNELWFPFRCVQNWRKLFFKTIQGLF